MDIDNGFDTTEGSHLSWRQVWDRRMARHGLTGTASSAPTPSRVADVVAAMCGAHAQVMSAAELSIGARLGGGTRADVRAALDGADGLVKTYGPRGTVHLLAARDLPMWTGALSALPSGPNGLPQASRLTDRQTKEIVEAIAVALADADEGLTVEELSDAVVAATGPWAGDLVMPAFQGMWPRWRQALHLAAHRGALCFGPDRGRKATYLSPSDGCPDSAPRPPTRPSTPWSRATCTPTARRHHGSSPSGWPHLPRGRPPSSTPSPPQEACAPSTSRAAPAG